MNPDGKTFNQTIAIKRRSLMNDHDMSNSTNSSTVNDTTKSGEEVILQTKTKAIQLAINASGNENLMLYYNKQQNQVLALSNDTLKVNIVSDLDIGLLGVFDTSDTIALTVDYQLSLVDSINFTGN
jgi:hypothetical protein